MSILHSTLFKLPCLFLNILLKMPSETAETLGTGFTMY